MDEVEVGPIDSTESWQINPLQALQSPWAAALLRAYDAVLFAMQSGMRGRGFRQVPASLTTTTVSSPSGLGSDSIPVEVHYQDASFFLSDSAQFLLEYSLRIDPSLKGCFYILPSFRGDKIDDRHLTQFLHCEAEICGGLEDVKTLIRELLIEACESLLESSRNDLLSFGHGIAHLESFLHRPSFETLSFVEAERILREHKGAVTVNSGGGRSLTAFGESELLRRVGAPFVWVENYDAMAVPFYQRLNPAGDTALNADLLFGLGEVVGAGARHVDGASVRRSLAAHALSGDEYAWYVDMKDGFPLETSGFGLGLERFLAWAFGILDVRRFEVFPRDQHLRGVP